MGDINFNKHCFLSFQKTQQVLGPTHLQRNEIFVSENPFCIVTFEDCSISCTHSGVKVHRI